MRKIITIVVVVLLATGISSAQQESISLAVDVKEKSVLSIYGSSNIVDFKLYQPGARFIREKLYITASRQDNKLYLSENRLEIPVKDFTSTNKMALRDFYKLMKSDDYPVLEIELDHIQLSEPASGTAGNAVIDVTIADITRKYTFPVTANKKGNSFTFDLQKEISIRDFQLKPPVHMLGMLKVDEWITINLYMVCDILPEDLADLAR
ncbi:MAG: YceI family protein [Proteiniphilum sp.]|nr:YceI family protein [Proteiniphilum sp.]